MPIIFQASKLKEHSSYPLLRDDSKTCDLNNSHLFYSQICNWAGLGRSSFSVLHEASAEASLRGAWRTPFQEGCQPRAQPGCGPWALVPLHVALSTGFSEAPLPQAPSCHGGWVPAEPGRRALVGPGLRGVLYPIGRGRSNRKARRFHLLLGSARS